jgi:YD repeat-containing protein
VLQYTTDGMNRVTRRTDPDQYMSSNICYNLDGSVFYSETGWQYHLDGGPSCPTDGDLKSGATPPPYAVAYGYDPDGNVATETRHHNCVLGGCKAGHSTVSWCTKNVSIGAGTTCKYYDGLDRLVEVKLPQADSDAYMNPWVTRYLYDLDGSQKTFHMAQFQAYGNLYATQELLGSGAPSINYNADPQTVPNTTYQNVKATAYDGVDRAVAKYSLVNQSGTETLSTATLTWDTSPLDHNVAGLLGTDCNAVSQCQQFDYREDGKEKTFDSSPESSPMRTYTYDPDGRTETITSDAYANAQQYTYDADGRLSTSTDPSGETNGNGDLMSPAVLTHNYYADGTLESLDVASTGTLHQSGLFSYSYRQDGLIGTETINDGQVDLIKNAGITNIVYTYDNTGRMNNRAETGIAKNATPTAITYDGYGQEYTYSSPATSLLDFSYSAEGELLNTTIKGSSQGPDAWVYSLRGELVSSPSSQNYLGEGGFLANGVMIRLQPSNPTSYYWDAYMGVQTQQVPFGSNSIPTTWNYSLAGQMNGQSAPWKQFSDGTFEATAVGRTYDAENHLLDTEFSGANVGPPVEQGISWGPNGHPIMIGTFDSSGKLHNEVLHWDGNQLLFASNGSNAALDDIKIGAQGDILPQDTGYAGLTFYDRGPGGVVIGCHNAMAKTFAGLGDSWNQTFFRNEVSIWHSPCFPQTTQNEPNSIRWFGSAYDGTVGSDLGSAMGSGGVLGMPRADGLTDGFDTIQGVRSYDNTSGSWTTPDAYAGDVHDPMSQKSFLWNGNNPVSYADPSGYDTILMYDLSTPVVVGHVAIFITGDAGDKGMYLCQCGSTNGRPSGPSDLRGGMTRLSTLVRGAGGQESRYDVGRVFHTSDAQQAQIIAAFADAAAKGYNLFDNNCDEVCSRALHSVGINPEHGVGTVVPSVGAHQTGATSLQAIDDRLNTATRGAPSSGTQQQSGGAGTADAYSIPTIQDLYQANLNNQVPPPQ